MSRISPKRPADALLKQGEQGDLTPDAKLPKLVLGAVHTIFDELDGTALFLDLEALSPAHLKAVIVQRDLLSFAILCAVSWIPRLFDAAGPSSSDEIADRFADYLIAGLRS